VLVAGVLLISAVASALTQERRPRASTQAAPPAAQAPSHATSGPVKVVRFVVGPGPGAVQRVALGQHVTVSVQVDQPALVSAPDLGLSAPANPGTPASFDLYTTRSGRFALILQPIDGVLRRAGTLVVTERRAQ